MNRDDALALAYRNGMEQARVSEHVLDERAARVALDNLDAGRDARDGLGEWDAHLLVFGLTIYTDGLGALGCGTAAENHGFRREQTREHLRGWLDFFAAFPPTLSAHADTDSA